jgi:cytochrome o ubiquinol oxidase subunit II
MQKNLSVLFYLLLFIGLVMFTLLLLRGGGLVLLEPKGVIAESERTLIVIANLLMLSVVVPVYALTFYFASKYRAGNKAAHYMPKWDHSKREEFIWWGIPAVIVLVLSVLAWRSSHDLDPFKPLVSDKAPIHIQVVALEWKWLFIYPEEGVASVGEIAIPVDTPVEFEITGDAPMNSFWIPALGGQIYAMTGMRSKIHLSASEIGIYDGSSANYSGYGFSWMKFKTKAMSESGYRAWLENAALSSTTLDHTEYARLAIPSRSPSVILYGSVTEGMFDSVLQKYMPPMKSSHQEKGGMPNELM